MSIGTKPRPQPQHAFAGYMTITAGSALCQVSPPTLRAEADSGRIRSLRDPAGRRLLWREDVEAYAESRRQRKERSSAAAATDTDS
jgi:hypothetical protein